MEEGASLNGLPDFELTSEVLASNAAPVHAISAASGLVEGISADGFIRMDPAPVPQPGCSQRLSDLRPRGNPAPFRRGVGDPALDFEQLSGAGQTSGSLVGLQGDRAHVSGTAQRLRSSKCCKVFGNILP